MVIIKQGARTKRGQDAAATEPKKPKSKSLISCSLITARHCEENKLHVM